MEARNALIKKAEIIGVLEPLGVCCIQERIFLYADDVILFTSPNQQNLVATQNILEMFALASGLNINQNKCAIIPICYRLNETALLMQFLHGNLQVVPINYLCIPLSVTRPKKSDLQPLVDKVVTGLPTWKARLLTMVGRTILVKVKLSAIPVHKALAISIPRG
jgi:hypothetical protein